VLSVGDGGGGTVAEAVEGGLLGQGVGRFWRGASLCNEAGKRFVLKRYNIYIDIHTRTGLHTHTHAHTYMHMYIYVYIYTACVTSQGRSIRWNDNEIQI